MRMLWIMFVVGLCASCNHVQWAPTKTIHLEYRHLAPWHLKIDIDNGAKTLRIQGTGNGPLKCHEG